MSSSTLPSPVRGLPVKVKKHAAWDRIQWRSVVFSDESRFCIDHADGHVHVWRRSGKRYQADCVREHDRLTDGASQFQGQVYKSCVRFKSVQSSSVSNNQYCVDLVRKYDYENYLGTLLLPKNVQRAAFALRAFNVELAQVQDAVSENKIGLMRMQFWRDAVAKIVQGNPPQAPVATELAGACGYYKLTKCWLERIVESRAAQLDNDFFKSIKAMEEYAENVNSSLYYLLLECLGIKNTHADHAASHLGKAQGIVTAMRATPFHASKRRVYLPIDILFEHKVSNEDIMRGKTSQSVKDAVVDVASIAHQHLEKARSLRSSLPPQANPVFLNASICDHYLKNLQRVDFNVFDGKLQHKNALLAYHMYANKLRKKF
ncbi:NADH dehydrogenase (ubiquinone) complex I, assembly factor 6 [Elysia marginata]|uniref:NADH dehydrogenase (ubiquinone) complex I, assembly factor 6 n=1 Tax=Elysia marginata TaxID=1093978 RepID=A0AAV4I2K9_9GAST|nr:NADH dehydrogenase (ubiquinone) complex I, assembly factor 6 [Elysia marginata]